MQPERPVKMQPEQKILSGLRAHLDEQQFDEERRAENLLEIRLQLRAESKADEPPQAHVFRRPVEGLEMRGVYGHLPDFFNIGRMAQAGERVAVKQFEDFRVSSSHTQQQNPVGQTRGESRRTALELLAHVLATIPDRFEPTIRFLNHGFNNSACRSASMVSIPDPRRILIVANVCASGFTPPVAESN